MAADNLNAIITRYEEFNDHTGPPLLTDITTQHSRRDNVAPDSDHIMRSCAFFSGEGAGQFPGREIIPE